MSRIGLACAAIFAAGLIGATEAGAADWTSVGAHRIVLQTRDGGGVAIGDMVIARDAAGLSYRVVLDPAATKGYFLSMREFKCVSGADIQCHVPYPYDHPHHVGRDDLAWLEHDLLFLSKSSSEFGAYLTNGIYYHLTEQDGALVGRPEDIDLNRIASPPADPTTPPFDAAERQASVKTRWITGLIIERDPH